MIDAESIRNAHRNCGCLTEDRLDTVDYSPHSLRRHGCQLKIRGLRLAINCDSCRAYGSNDIRPDLFVLRETDGTCEWIVIEIQSTMDRAATRQVAAGLRTLAEDPLFADSLNCKPRVLFRIQARSPNAGTTAVTAAASVKG